MHLPSLPVVAAGLGTTAAATIGFVQSAIAGSVSALVGLLVGLLGGDGAVTGP